METLSLFVDVPICSFRPNWSREYQDTYPFPPPSTVFGMLLSLIGVEWTDKARFAGVRMALAVEVEPEVSRVFRKLRRVPQSNKKADPLTSRRPDYQDLLIGLRLWIWLQDGGAASSLIERISAALARPFFGTVRRYGGLCLGESHNWSTKYQLSQPQAQEGFCVGTKGAITVCRSGCIIPGADKARPERDDSAFWTLMPLMSLLLTTPAGFQFSLWSRALTAQRDAGSHNGGGYGA